MSLPERVRQPTEAVNGAVDRISRRWSLDCGLASSLVRLDEFGRSIWEELRNSSPFMRSPALSRFTEWPGLYIISGYRDSRVDTGRAPSASNSLHRRCPSLAADLRLGNASACLTGPPIWATFGARWKLLGVGYRWGGDFDCSPTCPCLGWERDYNHFDVGA